MSLIERLEKQAKWHERRTWDSDGYWQGDEDARALLTEAVERIRGLEQLIDQQRNLTHA